MLLGPGCAHPGAGLPLGAFCCSLDGLSHQELAVFSCISVFHFVPPDLRRVPRAQRPSTKYASLFSGPCGQVPFITAACPSAPLCTVGGAAGSAVLVQPRRPAAYRVQGELAPQAGTELCSLRAPVDALRQSFATVPELPILPRVVAPNRLNQGGRAAAAARLGGMGCRLGAALGMYL